MNIDRSVLAEAAERGLISNDQADQLWKFVSERGVNTPNFRFTHVLYYLGGMIAICAMSLFITMGWGIFGGWGLFGIALAYGALGLWLTERLLASPDLKIPAGITAAFVVAITPLVAYGVQEALGLWADGLEYHDYHTRVDSRWLTLEVATLAAGIVMLWRYRLPFLVLPVAFTLWYMSMDLTPFLFRNVEEAWDLRLRVSLWFGLANLILAFWVDIRTSREKDYAFWLYIFGVITFWGGLSLMQSDSELNKFFYFCINLLLIVIGATLSRRVFAVFGGIGAAGYLGYLAHVVFKDSVLFPFALSAIGLGVIYLGILWQRHEQAIATRLRKLLPPTLRALVDRQQ